MGDIHLRKYGVATTIDFALYETDGTDLKTDAVAASGDVTLYRDEANVETLDADTFTDEGAIYSLQLSATEMQAARIIICVVDQGSKAWLDKTIIVETYGNASAQHAFDLDSATVNLSSTTETQIDNIETDTNEIQGKLPTNYIMGSSDQTDKDDEIDAIKAVTDTLSLATIADAVHDEALSGHTTSGTAGLALQNILKIGKNKWAYSGTSFIIYDDDDTTPLYSFTLDSATSPTSRTPA